MQGARIGTYGMHRNGGEEDRLIRAFLALPDFFFCRGIIYHYERACLRGGTPQPPGGGTFSVRVDEGKHPNPSCSSPNTLVLKNNFVSCTRHSSCSNIHQQGHVTQSLCLLHPNRLCAEYSAVTNIFSCLFLVSSSSTGIRL